MSDRGLDERMWAGGGSSWDSTYTNVPETPAGPTVATPGVRKKGSFGTPQRLGASGVVPGRFIPLHRGHQLVIDFALASVEAVTIAVATRPDDPISFAARASWLHRQYPGVPVVEVQVDLARPTTLARELRIKPTHLFGSEVTYRAAADALGATFVPVDPARVAVPISGTALRANVMEHFAFLAPAVRPWCVRRVAVVGAESTGKTTLCQRLGAELRAAVAPEWTRTLVDADPSAFTSEAIQLIARGQVAVEDALAAQAPEPVLLCDTELRTVWLWSKRLFEGDPPDWIRTAIAARPYDLYLLCAPDIPFVGGATRDLPAERRAFHDDLARELAGANVVELTGSRDERFAAAMDAIVSLYSPQQLLSARGLR
jgi:NadR type nicotinamide-nucleotide adenylyltransferase